MIVSSTSVNVENLKGEMYLGGIKAKNVLGVNRRLCQHRSELTGAARDVNRETKLRSSVGTVCVVATAVGRSGGSDCARNKLELGQRRGGGERGKVVGEEVENCGWVRRTAKGLLSKVFGHR